MSTIVMPSLGESVSEGEIGKWLVTEGQRVEKDQPLVEVLTDKADSEIPATEGGVVTKIFAAEGDVIAVGDNLCELDPAGEATAGAPAEAAGDSATADTSTGSGAADSDVVSSPSVRKLAREEGVDLGKVQGSGSSGRVTQDDVRRAADGGASPAAIPPVPPAAIPASSSASASTAVGGVAPQPAKSAFKVPPYKPSPGDEVIPYNRRRRIIADHMVYSKLTAPHVVTFAECDLHAAAKVREAHKKAFKADGLNLTYLSFVAAATCRALREVRAVNARVLDDAYVIFRDINLGVAVDTPDGLVVPVIRNADELSVRGIARAIDDIATRARNGDLTPDDLANKTFTISNPGRKGNLVGGAIISQPNVGILRIGEIKKRVVVVEKDGEDLMAIHPVMQMALSYDHRIVDGVAANGFLWTVNDILQRADFEL